MIWQGKETPSLPKPNALQWLLVGVRGLGMGVSTAILILLYILCYYIEKILQNNV